MFSVPDSTRSFSVELVAGSTRSPGPCVPETGVAVLDFTRTPFEESDTLGALSDSPVQEWIDTTMNGFWKDIAFGVRTQLKTPAVTLALIVTLAFGLGANTVAFSL